MEKISIYQDHRREQNFFSDSTGSKVAKIASSNTSFKPFCNMKLESDILDYSFSDILDYSFSEKQWNLSTEFDY